MNMGDIRDDRDDAKDKQNYKLAKAEDIYVIDNSFFGRMFPVLSGTSREMKGLIPAKWR